MNEIECFELEKLKNIEMLGKDTELKTLAIQLLDQSRKYGYSYNFKWLGRPVIQVPEDLMVLQEIIWDIQPDVIIETGIAHGGGLVFYASLLELIGKGVVIGIDIDIRDYNREAIELHPMSKRITLLEGSSVDKRIVNKVSNLVGENKTVMVCLDSDHSHDHVMKELILYSPFVSVGSYLVVFDTLIEDMPRNAFPGKSWGTGNNAATAVKMFLKTNSQFVVHQTICNKLLLSSAPGGYLKRI